MVRILNPGRESNFDKWLREKKKLDTDYLTANTRLFHFIVLLIIWALRTRNTGIGLKEVMLEITKESMDVLANGSASKLQELYR